MYALSDPEQVGYGLGGVIVTLGSASLVAFFYLSAALERPFGLAMVKNGRNRIGEVVKSPVGGELVDVEITSHVLFDPEGNRRDG